MPESPSDAPRAAPPLNPPPAAPIKPTSSLPGTENPAIPATSFEPSQDDSAKLTIWVPADAKVTINGLPTRSTGSKRQYVSFGLKPGLSYRYDVRAQIVRDGQLVEEVRSVVLTAGQRGGVAFGFNTRAGEGLAAN